MFAQILAATILQTQQATPATPPPTPYSTQQEIAEPERLALTPRIDGVRAAEEWDPLARLGSAEAYFQWEPGKLHFAGRLPQGSDLVFSMDLKGNGWLVGKDNLEVRLSFSEGAPKLQARMLDATDPKGPRWIGMPGVGIASVVAATQDSENKTWFVEATLEDPGLGLYPTGPAPFPTRVDTIATDASDREPFLPRVLTPLRLRLDRAVGLPEGVKWKPEGAGQIFTPNEQARVRLTFGGRNEFGLRRIDMRCEGYAAEGTHGYSLRFPRFDQKGRAFVDYTSPVDGVPMGFRLMRATITAADGAVAVGQVSYRIAPSLDLDLVRQDIESEENPQKLRMTVFLRSNTSNRLDGTLNVVPPAGFEVSGISGRSFVIYGRGSVRRVFDLVVPQGAKGTYPLSLQALLGNRTIEQTAYITVR